jgi:hypothetical protein
MDIWTTLFRTIRLDYKNNIFAILWQRQKDPVSFYQPVGKDQEP